MALPWAAGCGEPMPGTAMDGAAMDAGVTDGSGMDGDVCAEVGAPSFTLGTGVSAFELLPSEGAVLELVRGPQGGFHVYGAVRLARIDPDGAELDYEVRRADDGSTLTLVRRVRLSRRRIQLRTGGCMFRLGDLLIFDPDRFSVPADVEGLQVEVSATLRTADGVDFQDARAVRLVDEEADPVTR